MRLIIADLETDGLLDTVSTVHILVARVYIGDAPAGPVLVYRSAEGMELACQIAAKVTDELECLEVRRAVHEEGSPSHGALTAEIETKRKEMPGHCDGSIEDGLAVLATADVVVGHNWATYDDAVLQKLAPHFEYKDGSIIRDTLVMSRMQMANVKDKDFRLFEKGQLDGKYIGRHELGAWGQRLGLPKGDYSDVRKAEAKALGLVSEDELRKFVWGTWNVAMESYAVRDIEVTELLWGMLKKMQWPEESVRLEHRIHHIMHLQQEFGFDFDVDSAQELAGEVNKDHDRLHADTVQHFGKWWRPVTWSKVAPRPEYGEDDSRKSWGDVVVPAKTLIYKDPLRANRDAGNPFCPIKVVEFNPNSRPMIVDRLTKIYDWEPVDFTEKGNVVVDDDVLRTIASHIPVAENLAELFFLRKLLGQLETGANAWLGVVDPKGKIHHYVNTGGTVSRRASHLSPNLAQVPKVASTNVRDKATGDYVKKVIDKLTGQPFPYCFNADGTEKKGTVLKGRAGNYGFECRSLFRGPACAACFGFGHFQCDDGSGKIACAECSGTGRWHLMGCDLKGIELRCLGARLAEFDGGAYLDIILHGDPHTANMIAFQLDSRDNAKTCLYAIMYGGGDLKIGSIVMPPSATAAAMKSRGKALKANLQSGIPAFGKLIKKIGKDARKGFLTSLDGGKLFVRSPHAALNLQLQSDAALIAKLWVVFFYDMMNEAGYVFGVDWGMCAWVHDEIQAACRTRAIAEHAAELCKQAATEAGEYYEYASPVEADAKIGTNWQQTH